MQKESIIQKVIDAVIKAGSTFREDQLERYRMAIQEERNSRARWLLENLLENAIIAEKNQGPLCDDTGVPHILLEIGRNRRVSGELLERIHEGIAIGLRKLPGRPMAIKGDGTQRLDQSGGLDRDPGALLSAPFIVKHIEKMIF